MKTVKDKYDINAEAKAGRLAVGERVYAKKQRAVYVIDYITEMFGIKNVGISNLPSGRQVKL